MIFYKKTHYYIHFENSVQHKVGFYYDSRKHLKIDHTNIIKNIFLKFLYDFCNANNIIENNDDDDRYYFSDRYLLKKNIEYSKDINNETSFSDFVIEHLYEYLHDDYIYNGVIENKEKNFANLKKYIKKLRGRGDIVFYSLIISIEREFSEDIKNIFGDRRIQLYDFVLNDYMYVPYYSISRILREGLLKEKFDDYVDNCSFSDFIEGYIIGIDKVKINK